MAAERTCCDSKTIGQGSYAQVTSCGHVAIKTLPTEHMDSAIREISFINVCDHPNVIKLDRIELGQANTKLHMKRYACDLREFIKHYGKPSLDAINNIAQGLISGINHIHSKGIIHGDIKPQNILIEFSPGKLPTPVICDFGISMLENEKYHTGRAQTCTYRAPEVNYDRNYTQYSCKIDMWSIGCILLELASGRSAVRYVNDNEDSSWYACELYGLHKCRKRSERIKLLKNLTYKRVNEIIYNKFRDNKKQYDDLYELGYIQILNGCLHPHHAKRIDSIYAKKIVEHCFGKNSLAEIYVENNHRDNLTHMQNMPTEIVSALHHNCCVRAENIYEKYLHLKGGENEEVKYACIFIATCLFSGTREVKNILSKYIPVRKLQSTVRNLIATLGGRII